MKFLERLWDRIFHGIPMGHRHGFLTRRIAWGFEKELDRISLHEIQPDVADVASEWDAELRHWVSDEDLR